MIHSNPSYRAYDYTLFNDQNYVIRAKFKRDETKTPKITVIDPDQIPWNKEITFIIFDERLPLKEIRVRELRKIFKFLSVKQESVNIYIQKFESELGICLGRLSSQYGDKTEVCKDDDVKDSSPTLSYRFRKFLGGANFFVAGLSLPFVAPVAAPVLFTGGTILALSNIAVFTGGVILCGVGVLDMEKAITPNPGKEKDLKHVHEEKGELRSLAIKNIYQMALFRDSITHLVEDKTEKENSAFEMLESIFDSIPEETEKLSEEGKDQWIKSIESLLKNHPLNLELISRTDGMSSDEITHRAILSLSK